MTFRHLYSKMDELSALRWFRREIDQRTSIVGNESMRTILGENYNPRYERLLQFLPFEQFRDVTPLGHGSYGAVYAASWNRPQSFEHKKEEIVPVILKRVLPTLKLSDRQKLEKFLHEVCFPSLRKINNSLICPIVLSPERLPVG